MSDINIIDGLIKTELQQAAEKHHQTVFSSDHEAYGVIKEEIEEANEDFDLVKSTLNQIWCDVRTDNNTIPNYDILYSNAIFTIQELIQVAAMCKKAISSRKLKGTP